LCHYIFNEYLYNMCYTWLLSPVSAQEHCRIIN
jgi:hypothetical protein